MYLPNAATVNPSARLSEALATLKLRQAAKGRLILPLGMVGPTDATEAQCSAAYRIGYLFAQSGIALICGGRGGVMEAASRGGRDAGGIVIGLLPEDDIRTANPYLSVGLATGMGEMRNALIARGSACLIAIGGGLGTLSEMALALKWEKPVFAMLDAEQVSGANYFDEEDELIQSAARWLAQSDRAVE